MVVPHAAMTYFVFCVLIVISLRQIYFQKHGSNFWHDKN